MKKLFLLTWLICAGSWVSGQETPQLPVDTLREWYAIKLTTEDILGTRTTLWRARAEESRLLREAVTLKDQQITTLEQMNASFNNSLTTCNETNLSLTKSNNSLKGWNKGLLAGVAVLTAILILR